MGKARQGGKIRDKMRRGLLVGGLVHAYFSQSLLGEDKGVR